MTLIRKLPEVPKLPKIALTLEGKTLPLMTLITLI